MRLLSIVHGADVRAELFDDVVRAHGHELDEWSIVDQPSAPRPLEEYDGVFVFGGAMNVDEEEVHPWLRREDELLRRLLAQEMPLLGVCLGGQLLAKAAGAHVGPSPEPEFGFVPARLTDAAADDALFGSFAGELDVFDAHGYAFHVPEGAVELARSSVCSQAFRLGDRAWGLQFHPEVRVDQVARWLKEDDLPNADELVAELQARYGEWSRVGETLCLGFIGAADRAASVR